jgi:hypothetical protein
VFGFNDSKSDFSSSDILLVRIMLADSEGNADSFGINPEEQVGYGKK